MFVYSFLIIDGKMIINNKETAWHSLHTDVIFAFF